MSAAIIDLDTPRARERAIRALVRSRCVRRGLQADDDLTYRAQAFALDCYQLHGDSAARALRRADYWLDAMTGRARPRGQQPSPPQPPRAA